MNGREWFMSFLPFTISVCRPPVAFGFSFSDADVGASTRILNRMPSALSFWVNRQLAAKLRWP